MYQITKANCLQPPKLIKKEINKNKKLFGFVGSIVSCMIKEKRLFESPVYLVHDWTSVRNVKFYASYNLEDNKYYRHEIYCGLNPYWISDQDTHVELLTDAINETIHLIFNRVPRQGDDLAGKYGVDFETYVKTGLDKSKQAFKPIVDEIVEQLQQKGGKNVTCEYIRTKNQSGYVIRYTHLDLKKLKNTHRVCSIMTKSTKGVAHQWVYRNIDRSREYSRIEDEVINAEKYAAIMNNRK